MGPAIYEWIAHFEDLKDSESILCHLCPIWILNFDPRPAEALQIWCAYFKPSHAVLQWIIQCSVLGVPKDLKSPAFCGFFFGRSTGRSTGRSHKQEMISRGPGSLHFQSPIPKKMCCPSSMDAMEPWMFCFWKLKSWSQEKVQQTFHNTWICLPFHC